MTLIGKPRAASADSMKSRALVATRRVLVATTRTASGAKERSRSPNRASAASPRWRESASSAPSGPRPAASRTVSLRESIGRIWSPSPVRSTRPMSRRKLFDPRSTAASSPGMSAARLGDSAGGRCGISPIACIEAKYARSEPGNPARARPPRDAFEPTVRTRPVTTMAQGSRKLGHNDPARPRPARIRSQMVRPGHRTRRAPPSDRTRLLDREQGILAFNERVLALAEDPAMPLLERLRFLTIVSSNLDEFFEVRIADLHQLVMYARGDTADIRAGIGAALERARALVDRQYRFLNKVLMPALSAEGIRILRTAAWTPA